MRLFEPVEQLGFEKQQTFAGFVKWDSSLLHEGIDTELERCNISQADSVPIKSSAGGLSAAVN